MSMNVSNNIWTTPAPPPPSSTTVVATPASGASTAASSIGNAAAIGSTDPFQRLPANLQALLLQLQAVAATQGTAGTQTATAAAPSNQTQIPATSDAAGASQPQATNTIQPHHHHHHGGGGGLLADLDAATSSSGTATTTAADATTTTATSGAAPDTTTSPTAATTLQSLQNAMQQALQAYGSNEATSGLPALTI